MCKEHMGVALALKVPVFFVVTKVDICPEHVLKHTLATLQAILKKPGVKKKPFMVGLQLHLHHLHASPEREVSEVATSPQQAYFACSITCAIACMLTVCLVA